MRFLYPTIAISASAIILAGGCEPQTVDVNDQATPTATPRPRTPTPEPVPELSQTDFVLVTMAVGDTSSTSIDLDGDDEEDYGLNSALNAIVKFLVDQINTLLGQMVAEGSISQETQLAIKVLSEQLLSTYFSVDNIEEGLQQMLVDTPWIQRVIPDTFNGTVTLEFHQAYDEGGGWYTFDTEVDLGDPLEGDLDLDTLETDSYGDALTLTIPIVDLGTSSMPIVFALEEVRNVETIDIDTLDGAIFGGGIPTENFETLIDSVLKLIGMTDLMTEDEMSALQKDVTRLLNDMADIELSGGRDAISACFVYDASVAWIY